uniref:Uncharacterized protein n=1 Tax=Rhizophora mucronata TaxID=61149 RepID=A0A2P2QQP5_RHIMU
MCPLLQCISNMCKLWNPLLVHAVVDPFHN